MKNIILITFLIFGILGTLAQVTCPEGFTRLDLVFSGQVYGAYEGSFVSLSFILDNAGEVSLNDPNYAGLCMPAAENPTTNQEEQLCPELEVSLSQVSQGYTAPYCFRETASQASSGSALYRIDFSSGLNNRGWCLKVQYPGTDNYAAALCADNNSQQQLLFVVNGSEPAPVYFKRMNPQITDTNSEHPVVYVDKYNAKSPRPNVPVFFTAPSEAANSYSIFPITVQNDFGMELNLNTMNLDTPVNIDDDGALHLLTLSHTNTARSTESASLNFRSVECDAGYYPVVFARYFASRTQSDQECYDLSNASGYSKSACSGGDWYLSTVPDNNYVHEHYECLTPGDYTLSLKRIATTGYMFTSWNTNSYLTILALSHREDNLVFDGYTIGDFAYTALIDSAGGRPSGEDRKTDVVITIGPKVCAADEKVVVIQKYSTTNANTEGFEIYNSNNDLVYSYFGTADIENQGFDPYTRVFLCLAGGNYRVRLVSRAYNNPISGPISCSGWSTTSSIEQVQYTTLGGTTTTSIHPSFMRIDVLTNNQYSSSNDQADIRYTIEGENYAVFSADRTHISTTYAPTIPETDIYTEYNCYYEFGLPLVVPATFDVTNNGVAVPDSTQYINVNINDPIDLDIKCNDVTDTQCTYIDHYEISCFSSRQPVNCASYGFNFNSNGVITAGSEGHFTTPSEAAESVTVVITSVIREESSAIRDPQTQVVNYNIHVDDNSCNTYFINQDESVSVSGVTNVNANEVTCTINGEAIDTTKYRYDVTTTSNGIHIDFHFSSYDMITCTFVGRAIHVYSKPSCLHNAHSLSLPLYQSVASDATSYKEECTAEHRANEYACVYDPLTMRAEIVNHETVCHDYTSIPEVPAGHGYVTGYFTIVPTTEVATDINVAYMPTWFKRLIEDAFENDSPVPMRNAYITEIAYNEEEQPNVKMTIVFDTAYEYANDLHDSLIDLGSFMNSVNAKLDEEIPSYFGTHDIRFTIADIELTPNMCKEVTDYEGFTFEYFNGQTTEKPLVNETVWGPTVIWYYAYNAVPSEWNPQYDEQDETFNDNGDTFWGAFTRYCKPKYYDAVFLGINPLSAVQTNVNGYNGLHFTVRITNLDPRSVNTETRYVVGRALTRYVINRGSLDSNFAELFDFNVHMIKGYNPVTYRISEDETKESEYYYRDTVFYVTMEVRSNDHDQFLRIREAVASAVAGESDNEATDEVASDIASFFGDYFPEDWRADQKDVYIYLYSDWDTSNVQTTSTGRRTLRY